MENNNDYLDLDSLKNGSQPEHVRKESKGYFYSGLIVGLASALLIVSVVFLGTRIQQYLSMERNQQAVPDNGQNGQSQSSVISADMLSKVQTIESIINQYYYQESIDQDAMAEGVFRGLVASLGDPYSTYYSPEELEELMNQTEGIYYGIGAGVETDPETTLPRISAVYNGTPAQEAGLQESDLIYEVNGESTFGISVSEVVQKIKGAEGTTVNLTIVRLGESDYLSVDVERREVNTPTVIFEMLNEEAAYIRITEFDTVTTEQFTEAMAMARGNQMKGLVLDLRSNPGGNLDTVVDIARMLLPEGLIVYTEDKYGERIEYSCDGTKKLDIPLVVLVNQNSASASEILAGAIKDYGIGTLVGMTTYGKGIVQRVLPLTDGSAVKVTTSSYFTPNGNNIHGIGVAPDIESPFDGEAYYNNPDRPDNQIDKALEILMQKIMEEQ